MPKLWDETIDAHRQQVREAILDATEALMHGEDRRVTMSQIADRAGIGRATLYKYFPDLEAVLHAWHARQIDAHLRHLEQIRDATSADHRLESVLSAYAMMTRGRNDHDPELATLLHQNEHVTAAQQRLRALIRDLIADAAVRGEIRADIAPEELAAFAVGALSAAGVMPSQAATRRLIGLTMTGMRPVR